MSRKYAAIPDECWDCPLSDCYPTNPRCPVLRKDLQSKGLPLPEIRDGESATQKRGRPRKPKVNVGAVANKREYNRKYQAERRRQKRLARTAHMKINITCGDLEILQSVCAKDGRTLEQELETLVTIMADRAREDATA